MENEEFKGLRDFYSCRIKMMEKERSNLSATVEDHGVLFSVAQIHEEEILANLGVVIWDLHSDLAQ